MMLQAFRLPSCMRLRRALSFLEVGVLACAVDGFFSARVSNPQTQRAYGRSGRRFLDCCGVLTGFPLGSLLVCLTLLTTVAWAQPQASYRIDTIAGGFNGDGGVAIQARLNYPVGVGVDSEGNLYIADTSNHRIRKVDLTGTITTIAGTGESGFGGDGGPAVEAQLDAPRGVAMDSTDNLYIADTLNQRIRKVDSTGTITTIAGTEERGFSWDGGPAVEARLDSPSDVAVDSEGNVYIADTLNQRIRKVDSTGTITTIAGTGERAFSILGNTGGRSGFLYSRGGGRSR